MRTFDEWEKVMLSDDFEMYKKAENLAEFLAKEYCSDITVQDIILVSAPEIIDTEFKTPYGTYSVLTDYEAQKRLQRCVEQGMADMGFNYFNQNYRDNFVLKECISISKEITDQIAENVSEEVYHSDLETQKNTIAKYINYDNACSGYGKGTGEAQADKLFRNYKANENEIFRLIEEYSMFVADKCVQQPDVYFENAYPNYDERISALNKMLENEQVTVYYNVIADNLNKDDNRGSFLAPYNETEFEVGKYFAYQQDNEPIKSVKEICSELDVPYDETLQLLNEGKITRLSLETASAEEINQKIEDYTAEQEETEEETEIEI